MHITVSQKWRINRVSTNLRFLLGTCTYIMSYFIVNISTWVTLNSMSATVIV